MSTVSAWNISDEEVPTIPERYSVQQSTVFLAFVDALQVVRVLCGATDRCYSNVVSYENPKDKASCVSSDGVDFRVRLYRGKGKFSHVIIMEI